MRRIYYHKAHKYFGMAIVATLGFLLVLGGCSRAKFEKSNTPYCKSDVGGCSFDETILTSGGMVDILFVDDNSGSMSFEQNKMAQRFPNLLNKLDERMLNYRIGITTTDISDANNPSRAINQFGALQDGRLISFSNGAKFLEPNSGDKWNLFLNTMQRPETLECEQYIKDSLAAGVSQTSNKYIKGYTEHCPSGDERGVVAALKTVTENSDGFIRPEAHLAIVIISDENERSWGNTDPQNSYVLAKEDKPKNLVNAIKEKFPEKSIAVHSVVVRSNDSSCLNIQNNQMSGIVKGQYGTVYEQLSKLTGGIVGNVCASDYGAQMGEIGAAIVQQVEYFMLHCENPENLQVIFEPSTAGTGYHLVGRRVVFDRQLDPSSKVRFIYNCPIIP